MIKHKFATVGVIFALFVGSLAMIPVLGFVYMPASAADSVVVDVSLPVGTKLETTEAVLHQLEAFVKSEVKGYKDISVLAGTSGNFGLGSASSYTGQITINLPPLKDRIDSEEQIKEKLRAHFDEIPGATVSFGSSGGMSVGGGSSAVNISVKSEDLDKAKATAYAIP